MNKKWCVFLQISSVRFYICNQSSKYNVLPQDITTKETTRYYTKWNIVIPQFLNFRTPQKFTVNYLEFKQRGQTIEYFVQKMQVEQQTVKTLIRLLLQEQSDLGLHCLPRPLSVRKLRVITVTLSFFIQIGLDKQCRPSLDCSQSSLNRVFTVCCAFLIILIKYPNVWPLCFNFR